MCCPVARSIAIHCDEPEQEVYICWACEESQEREEDLIEVLTPRSSYQHVCEECSEDYNIVY